jgi:hypothetical protein
VQTARRVRENEHAGGAITSSSREMVKDPFERITDVLRALRVSDGGNETVVRYDREDASRCEESAEVVVH